MIDFARWDLESLGRSWREARPFSHVIIDDLLAPDQLTALLGDVAREPHWRNSGELFEFMGSADQVQRPKLRDFQAALLGALPSVRAITAREAAHIELRSYVYLQGSYLLPHSDSRAGVGRRVAFAYYVYTEGCVGGELELFEVELEGDYAKQTRPALTVEPRANRLVLFDVSPKSLHQVREVLAGSRVSLAGWFVV